MTLQKLPLKQLTLAGIIPLLLLNIASYSPQVQASVTSSFSKVVVNRSKQLDKLNFPDNGTPTGRRRGGGSRTNGCPNITTPITALVPGKETNNTSFWTSTVAEYPTFWVYVPELPMNLRSGEFVLQNPEGKDIWRTPITLPGKSGAIAISLPQKPEYALQNNQKYHWYFQVFCGEPQKQPGYIHVDAWVQKVAITPELQQQLNTAKPRQYQVYAANNLWYDAVTNLAQLRRTNPGDRTLAEDWTKLLKAAGLENLAAAPIVQQ